MTIPDSPALDLDVLTALEQAVPAAPWRVAESSPAWGIRTEGGWELVYASYADSGPQVLAFIAAARNALPALLSALAAARADLERLRTNAELLSCSTMGEAFDRLEELLAAEKELAAARAERDHYLRSFKAQQAENERVHAKVREQYDVIEHAKRQRDEAIEQAKQAQAALREALNTFRGHGTDTCTAEAREDDVKRWALVLKDAGWNFMPASGVRLVSISPCGGLVPEAGVTSTAAPKADEPKPATLPCHCPDGRRVPYCLIHGDKPKACGSVSPDLPFVACTYPAGHAPIPIDVRGVGVRDMEHGNDGQYQTWWNGRTATVHGDALAAAPDPALHCGHQYWGGLRQPGDRPILCTLPAGHGLDHGEPETDSYWDGNREWGSVAISDPKRRDAEPVPAGGEDGSGTADGGVLSPADARRITDAIWGGGEERCVCGPTQYCHLDNCQGVDGPGGAASC